MVQGSYLVDFGEQDDDKEVEADTQEPDTGLRPMF
jgi:hypothetical protein